MVDVSRATKARAVIAITFVCFRGEQRRRDRGRECSVALPTSPSVEVHTQAIFLRRDTPDVPIAVLVKYVTTTPEGPHQEARFCREP